MYDIVVFPFHDWKKCQSQGLVRRDTQIVAGLARLPSVGTVLVVDRPVSLPMLAYNALVRQRSIVRGGRLVLRQGLTCVNRLSEKLYVLDMVVLDVVSALRLRNAWWPYIMGRESVLQRARRSASALGMSEPVLWLFTPISTPAIGRFGERLVVFDAIDNWVEHEGMLPYRDAARKGYEDVKRKADLAFCVSEDMQAALSGGRPRALWIPNGVDAELFRPSDSSASGGGRGTMRPRIGYVGVIDSRLDVALLRHCARSRPGLSFELVGPVRDRSIPAALSRLPNVRLLGSRMYEEMPACINGFDVCLIPHKVNRYTDGMNPLKLYEYLACGKPVVSTPVAGTAAFSDVVAIAGSPSEFLAAIDSSLSSQIAADAARRRNAVLAHSWHSRIERMWTEVSACLRQQG